MRRHDIVWIMVWVVPVVMGAGSVNALAEAAPAPKVSLPGMPSGAQPPVTPEVGAAKADTPLTPPVAGPAGSTAARPPGMDWSFMIILIGLMAFMILMTSMSGRRERKRRQELMSSLKKQDRVQTAGGLIGTIVELKDDEVVLRLEEGRVRMTRSAITQVLREARGVEPETNSAAASS